MTTVYVALQTNVPLRGKVFAAYYSHSDYFKEKKWPAQIQLYGEWGKFIDKEGNQHSGKGAVSLHMSLVDDLCKLGVISIGPQEDGHETFKVLSPDAEIQLLKKEKGKKKWTEVSLAGVPNEPGTVAPKPAAASSSNGDQKFREWMIRQRDLMVSCYKVADQVDERIESDAKVHEVAMAFFIQANRDRVNP